MFRRDSQKGGNVWNQLRNSRIVTLSRLSVVVSIKRHSRCASANFTARRLNDLNITARHQPKMSGHLLAHKGIVAVVYLIRVAAVMEIRRRSPALDQATSSSPADHHHQDRNGNLHRGHREPS